jgi:hypothetical protein
MKLGEIQVGVLGLGLGVLGTLYFFLGVFGEIYRSYVVFIFIVWLVVIVGIIIRSQEARERLFKKPVLSVVPFLLFLFLCLIIFLLSQLPPTARDALIQHLALPKLFIKEHSLAAISSASFSWYPMLVDLLYLLPLSFRFDTLPAGIHALFGLLTARLLYLYIEKEFNAKWAWFGVFLFLTVPAVFFLSTVAYVDLALVFYSFYGLVALLRWRDSVKGSPESRRWFTLSALSIGAAMATKYNGYIPFVFVVASCGWISSRAHAEPGGQVLKRMISYVLLTMLFAAPWLLRNLMNQGDPLFPLLGGLFGSSTSVGMIPPLALRQDLYHENWMQILTLPFRMFFSGEYGRPDRFDGRLNPMLLVMPLLALTGLFDGKKREVKNGHGILFLGFSLMYLCYALFLGASRVRYLVPIIPPLIVLGIIGLTRFQAAFRKGWIAAAALAGFALFLNGMYVVDYIQRLDPWGYLSGRESREVYLSRHLSDYPVYTYLNGHLPEKARVLLVFMGNRGYYCDRDYLYDSPLDGITLIKVVEESSSVEEIDAGLRRLGITHIVMNRPILVNYLFESLNPIKWELFQSFARQKLKTIYSHDPFYLFEV